MPVLLGLGANVGDRLANMERALDLLAPDCGPFRRSAVYHTPPWGDPDQGPFLNLVAAGHTGLPLPDLLRRVKAAEVAVGRVQTRRWGPRVVDVDILAYGDRCVATEDVEVPHPRLHERAFVLVPLAALDPQWRHPRLGLTAAALLAGLPPAETAAITVWVPDPAPPGPAGIADPATDPLPETPHPGPREPGTTR